MNTAQISYSYKNKLAFEVEVYLGLYQFSKMPEKCPYLEFFWSVFSRIRNECKEIRSISPYSVQMRENTD